MLPFHHQVDQDHRHYCHHHYHLDDTRAVQCSTLPASSEKITRSLLKLSHSSSLSRLENFFNAWCMPWTTTTTTTTIQLLSWLTCVKRGSRMTLKILLQQQLLRPPPPAQRTGATFFNSLASLLVASCDHIEEEQQGHHMHPLWQLSVVDQQDCRLPSWHGRRVLPA